MWEIQAVQTLLTFQKFDIQIQMIKTAEASIQHNAS